MTTSFLDTNAAAGFLKVIRRFPNGHSDKLLSLVHIAKHSHIRDLVARCAMVLVVGLVLVPPTNAAKLLHVWDCPVDVPLLDQVISPDERMVAQLLLASPSAGTDAAVQLVDFRTLCHIVEHQDQASGASPIPTVNYDMQFTGDGAFIVFAAGSSVRVLDGRDLKPVWRFSVPVRAHVGFVRGIKIASAAHIAAVLVKPEKPSGQSEPNLTVRPEFLSLVRMYDLDTGKVVADYQIGREFIDVSFAISPEGSTLAITVWPSSEPHDKNKFPDLLIVDAHTGKLLRQFASGVWGHIDFADEQIIYSGGTPRMPASEWSQRLLAYDIRRGKIVRQAAIRDSGFIRDVVASRDGKYVTIWAFACTSKQNCRDHISIWDSAFLFRAGFDSSATRLPSVKFSTSGRFLIHGTRIFEFDLH